MRVGLIGFPVAHSASPKMQNAAFAQVGLNWRYELWNTPTEELEARMQMLREDEAIAGANVTVPHKQNILPFLDDVSVHAKAIGAVNTILKKECKRIGDNTDWIGFLNDLRFHGIEPKRIERALVLGAGGSARAIVYALKREGANVFIFNRNFTRAESLAKDFDAHAIAFLPSHPERSVAGDAKSNDVRLSEVLNIEQLDLIVNCTSAGMSPNDDTSAWNEEVAFPSNSVLYELVYKPRETKLMRQAKASGARVIGGIGMLAEQGAAAFELWTGIASSHVSAIMREAITNHA
jgi:shikimate dehydrogenase